MALTIWDDMITSDRGAAVATWRPAAAADCAGAWVSTRLAKRLLSRQEAVNSLVLAELEADGRQPEAVDAYKQALGLLWDARTPRRQAGGRRVPGPGGSGGGL